MSGSITSTQSTSTLPPTPPTGASEPASSDAQPVTGPKKKGDGFQILADLYSYFTKGTGPNGAREGLSSVDAGVARLGSSPRGGTREGILGAVVGAAPQKFVHQQSPTQSVTQVPIGSNEPRTVKLDESAKNTIVMTSDKGNSLKIWGDPHIETVIDGRTAKFNIGSGAGTVRLSSGTKIEWDTKGGKFGGLSSFRVTRSNGESVAVNPNDRNFQQDVDMGLSDGELQEFAKKLETLAGSPYLKLGARTGYEALDNYITKITRS